MEILSKILSFLKEVRTEMRKINWLSREETLKYTLIVIGVSIAVAIFLGTVDFLVTFLINKFFL